MSQNTDLEPLNVLVFGPTGVGKSTIINLLASAQLPVGHSLQSCTQQVDVVSTTRQGRQINYFDTPGFDDSILTSAEQLARIGSILSSVYEAAGQTPNIHGVLYVHRITDNKMSGSTLRNLRVLERLLGSRALQNVVFVTNMWGSQPDPKHVEFEKELWEGHQYFASAIEQGARAGARYRIREGATEVQVQEALSDLFLNSTPVVLQIQRDMVDKKRALRDTDAGRIVDGGIEKAGVELRGFIHELKQDLANLSGGKEERKARVTLQCEDVETQFAQVKKQGGILQFTLETIREHPYLSTLVALAAIGTAGAIVLASGKVVVVAKFACAVKVAASGTGTAAAAIASPITGTGTGVGIMSATVNGNAPAGLIALATAAVASRMTLRRGSKQDKDATTPV